MFMYSARSFVFLGLAVPFLFLAPFVMAKEASSSAEAGRKENARELQERHKDLVASREAEIKTLRDDFKTRREEVMTTFKLNLQKIKDSRKQQVTENINSRITERNTRWVEHWGQVLKRLSALLDKIEVRATEASSKGKDISSVTSAISAARSAIALAQSKVDTQSTKTYTITIDTESSLGQNVKATIQSFHADVKGILGAINDARKAVDAVFKALRTVVGGLTTTPSATPVPTVSASPTPTSTP